MVILLVVLMFLALAGIGVWRRHSLLQEALKTSVSFDRLAFHPGHTWVACIAPNLYRVGADDVSASLAGTPEKIDLPSAGTRVFQDVRQTSVSSGHRVVRLLTPLSGRVMAVNPIVQDQPASVAADPYGDGWLYVVKLDKGQELRRLMTGDLARNWLAGVRRRITELLWTPSAAAAWDAGPLRPGYGKDLSPEQFEDLKCNLLT